MKAMESRSEPAERLLACVETCIGSGLFQLDERLLVEEVVQRASLAATTARFSVRLDDEFDAEEARRRYHPDLRVLVTTDAPRVEQRSVLFDGYVCEQSMCWDGRIGHEEEAFVFQGEHLFERAGRSRDSLVYGRWMRNGSIEDGLIDAPELFADRSVRVTVLPCVFNPEGIGNRAIRPLCVGLRDGAACSIPIFTWDGDSAAAWTFADVLAYLVWFHLPRGGLVRVEELLGLTQEGSSRSARLDAALRRRPDALSCEAVNLIEALALFTEASGICVSAETQSVEGRPVNRLRAWMPGEEPARALFLVRGGTHANGGSRYDVADRSVPAILRENNTYRCELSWRSHRPVNEPVILGGVKRYEMTLPLKPGWPPMDHLDNVELADRQAARLLALTPAQVAALGPAAEASPWFRRFHRLGSEFHLYSDVGRLWVLNEHGRRDPALFNRNVPFHDYRAFDFSTVVEAAIATRGSWSRRARRLLPPVSIWHDGRRWEVFVEVSFDGGVSWQPQWNGVRVLRDEIGIHLEVANPTEITPKGGDPAEQNLWYAIIDQIFRVRVTGVVESDERVVGMFPTGSAPSSRMSSRAAVLRRVKAFQYVARQGTTDVLRELSASRGLERNDQVRIDALAERLARQGRRRELCGSPVIPWIETGYGLGQAVSEIRGRLVRLELSEEAEPVFPVVITRRFVLSGGRYETVLEIGPVVGSEV